MNAAKGKSISKPHCLKYYPYVKFDNNKVTIYFSDSNSFSSQHLSVMEKRILNHSRVRKVDFELSTNILVLHKTYANFNIQCVSGG